MSDMQPMFDNVGKDCHTENLFRQRIMETERRLVEAGVMEAEAGDQQQPRRGHRRQRRRLPEIPKHKKRNEPPSSSQGL